MISDLEGARTIDGTKIARLEDEVRALGSAVVAYSGGADSALLLAVCLQVLGRDSVLAATADSPTLPRSELRDAALLAAELGAEHVVVATSELDSPDFAANSPDRCFFCKKELFDVLRRVADTRGFAHLVYGATAADLSQHRPGMRAAREAGARAPLLDAGYTKADVRALSRNLGLRTWDKPSAACLSSRVPYGEAIDAGKLSRIERAEDFLVHELGFRQARVRDHGTTARVEVELEDLPRLLDAKTRRRVLDRLKSLGYVYVTADLQGFRSGSMDEALPG